MIKTYTSLLLACLLFPIVTSAQASEGRWQWAQQEGGTNNFSNGENEEVRGICTDREGNVYNVGRVYKNPYFDNHIYITPASFGGPDAFIAKYDKCGHLKWFRLAGGTGLDKADEVIVDDSLNVYVLGNASSNVNQFPDSSQSNTTTRQGLFWAKYDSSGNLKWSHFSRPLDRINSFPSLRFKPNGNLTTEIVVSDTGIFYPGFNFRATHPCNALFDFDRNGNPVKIIPIDSTKPSFTLYTQNVKDVAYDQTGNMIMTYNISDTTYLLDTILYTPTNKTRYFLVKANPSTRTILWLREWTEDHYNQSAFGYVDADTKNNIYANGQAGLNSVFNGDSMKFSSTAAYSMAVFFKFDSNGNTIWKDLADNTNNAGGGVYAEPFTLYGNNQLCTFTNVSGPTYWGGDTLNSIGSFPNGTVPFFITFLNAATGELEYADSLPQSSPLNNTIRRVITDEQGNILFGGHFSAGLTTDSSHIYNNGGNNDAYIIKWGLPCADSIALIAPLSAHGLIASANGNAIDVTWQNVSQYADKYRVYRSATDSLSGYSLIDSVSNLTNHYTDVHALVNQAYWYKVSAVNNAGEAYSNADSASIRTVGIAEITSIRHISLYPNPAISSTELSVWNDADKILGTILTITDMSGREMYNRAITLSQGKNDFVLDISAFGSGIFILNLKGDGGSYSRRLVIVK